MQPTEAMVRIDRNLARIRQAVAAHAQQTAPAALPSDKVGSPKPQVSPSAQFGNGVITAQAFQNDPDLVFCRKMPTGPAADVLYDLLGRLFGP